MIDAAALIAIRDALVSEDYEEAYHILRMQADPDCKVFLRTRDHFTQWEEIAKHSPALTPAKRSLIENIEPGAS